MLSITTFLPVLIVLALVIGAIIFGIVKLSNRSQKRE